MKLCKVFLSACGIFFSAQSINGFMTNVATRISSTRPTYLQASLKEEGKVVDTILAEMHESNFLFRIVVVGNGAILETTSVLGPAMKSSVSPKSGERLVTLASEDQSFEFHVKVDQVEKIVFAETKRPIEGGEKVLRICRLMNGEGGSICSLILVDKGDEAVQWYDGMKERFG